MASKVRDILYVIAKKIEQAAGDADTREGRLFTKITFALVGWAAFRLAKSIFHRLTRTNRPQKEEEISPDTDPDTPEFHGQPTSMFVRAAAGSLLMLWSEVLEFIASKFIAKVDVNSTVPTWISEQTRQILWALPNPLWKFWVSIIVFTWLMTMRRNEVLPYAVPFLIPLTTFFAATKGNFFQILYTAFLLIPLLELVFGVDRSNPSQAEATQLNQKRGFKLLTILWTPLQVLFLVWALWLASVHRFSPHHFLGFALSVGFNTGGLGINIAHELIHKNNWLEQTCGKILLTTVCYGHWYTEHLYGHHRMVSTPYDPASSRYGESFYRFWCRSVAGTWRSAWHLENQRLQHLSGWRKWCGHTPLQLTSASVLMGAAIARIFGRQALLLFICQSVFAFSLLELVNYIEHYGLARKKRKEGSEQQDVPHGVGEKPVQGYEPVNIRHSWNADAHLTNLLLFKLQRHSDHHAFASRRYQILRSFPESPQMPTGYGGMMTLALLPPLWFKIMNPRVAPFQTN